VQLFTQGCKAQRDARADVARPTQLPTILWPSSAAAHYVVRCILQKRGPVQFCLQVTPGSSLTHARTTDPRHCCACRCRGLEVFTVEISTAPSADDGANSVPVLELHLAGQGTNPSDRVASMQAQLAAFRTTPNFLNSANWHLLQPCLTTLVFINPSAGAPDHPMALPTIFASPLHLLQIPSLRSLEVDFSTMPASLGAEQEALVSNLLQLTHLAGTVADSNRRPMDSFWSHAASLPRLRAMDVAGDPGEAFTIPCSWRSCSSLTSLIFNSAITSLANLSSLQSLPCLQSLKLACAPADLAHLRRLVHLTFLDVTCVGELGAAGQQQAQGAQQQPAPLHAQQQQPAPLQVQQQPAAGAPAAGQGAAGAGAVQGAAAAAAPAVEAAAAAAAEAAAAAVAAAAAGRWACSSTLVHLEWEDCLEAAPLQQVTRLSKLCLCGPSHQPNLPDSVLAPLARLKHVQDLELVSVKLTPDLCW
jgi:hypothetical protein